MRVSCNFQCILPSFQVRDPTRRGRAVHLPAVKELRRAPQNLFKAIIISCGIALPNHNQEISCRWLNTQEYFQQCAKESQWLVFRIRKTFCIWTVGKISISYFNFQDQLTAEVPLLLIRKDGIRNPPTPARPPSSSPFFIPSWRASQHVIQWSIPNNIEDTRTTDQFPRVVFLYKGHAKAVPIEWAIQASIRTVFKRWLQLPDVCNPRRPGRAFFVF